MPECILFYCHWPSGQLCTLLSASSITATNTLCFFQIELKVSCMSSHFQSVVREKPGIQHLYPKILTGFMVISCDSGQAGYLSPPQPLLLNITGFISATCTIPLFSFMPLLPTQIRASLPICQNNRIGSQVISISFCICKPLFSKHYF